MLMKQASIEANSIISNSEQLEDKLRKSTQGVERGDFKKYKPLYEGLRKNSHFSLMIDFFVILWRLSLLYIAMFLA